MVDIFGLGAAAVDSHRRDGGLLWCCVHTMGTEEVVLDELRKDRTQHLATLVEYRGIAAKNERPVEDIELIYGPPIDIVLA